MKMAMKEGKVLIKDADPTQAAVIKSWGAFKWNRGTQLFIGDANLENLTRLAKMVRLPEIIEETRIRLQKTQDAVEAERKMPRPEALTRYPVKKTLYEHQIRAANMALLIFGLLDPERVEMNGDDKRAR